MRVFLSLILLVPAAAHAAGDLFLLQSPDGRRLVTAAESRTPIVLDGALDEEVWRLAEPADGFVQAEPHEGDAASEPPKSASPSTAMRCISA